MTQGVEFLHTLYQCRELSAAVVRYATDGTLRVVQQNLDGGEHCSEGMVLSRDGVFGIVAYPHPFRGWIASAGVHTARCCN